MRKSITLYGQEILSWLDNFRQNQRYPEKISQKCWNSSTELRWKFKIELLNSFVLKICLQIVRGGSRTAATSKMERFVIIVNGWKPLKIRLWQLRCYCSIEKVFWVYPLELSMKFKTMLSSRISHFSVKMSCSCFAVLERALFSVSSIYRLLCV